MDELGKRLTKDLMRLINEASGKEQLEAKYAGQVFYIEPVHGDDVLDEALQKLEVLYIITFKVD